jgi:nucleotide-binding universal stress UspA family protein
MPMTDDGHTTTIRRTIVLYKIRIMKSVVVPVNFSTCAGNAAKYAADLALALHADLHLIHVIQVPVTTAELTMTEFLYEEMVEAANLSMTTLRAELVKRTGSKLPVHVNLEAGNICAKVNSLCKKLDTYAVVLGATGPSVEKFLAGSPVFSLLHHIPYPILVVPDHIEFEPFHRVILACDLEDIGIGIPQSLPLLWDIYRQFDARFDVLTVETRKKRGVASDLFDRDAWKAQLQGLQFESHFVKGATVEEGLLNYLAGQRADLVIVFPKKHGFFEFHVSQSKKVARHSPIPVMSLHE